jgi:deoxyribonucleoside regulator
MDIPRDHLNAMYMASMMYYMEGRDQSQVARTLGVSRPTVSRLLAQAREQGIVRISVVNPFANNDSQSEQIRAALSLDSVVVVAGHYVNQEQVRIQLSHAAAQFLQSILRKSDVVGVGWGRTLYKVAEVLDKNREFQLTLIPLVGGVGQIAPSFQVHAIASLFSARLGGVWHPLYVPAIIDNEDTRRILLASRDVATVANAWDRLDVAVVGIGTIPRPDVQILFGDYLDADTIGRMERAQVVGDICMHFFDIDGNARNDVFPGVFSIELEQLKMARFRVGVAGGGEKAEAIIGASRGGWINMLVTDEAAAVRILELMDGSTELDRSNE